MFFIILIIFPFPACNTIYNYKSYTYSEKSEYAIWDIFVPKILMDSYRMRDFISSDYFHLYKRMNGDLAAIDELYTYALWLTDNNIEESLFIISMSTLPYKKSPAKFPLLKFDFMFYFSIESDSLFSRRYTNLPSVLFEDSPRTPFGDRDKTPHFFGSAYLAYISDSRILPGLAGYLIETGEYLFEFEGFMDKRDIKTNKTGAGFGLALLRNPETLPSKYLGKLK
jgi:hypothetical protein